jgi:hypothetical protein
MTYGKAWGLVFGLLFSWTLLAAQAPSQQLANRERFRENLNNLRLLRMTEALGLTEEQTSKIYPVSARVEKEKIEIVRTLGTEMRGLKDVLAGANPKDEDLAVRVKAIKELRRGLQQKDQDFEDFLEANLTQLQKAKYLIFQAEFNRALRDKLNRARTLLRNRRPF